MEIKEKVCNFLAKVNDVEVRIVAGLHRVLQFASEEQKKSQITGGMERA